MIKVEPAQTKSGNGAIGYKNHPTECLFLGQGRSQNGFITLINTRRTLISV